MIKKSKYNIDNSDKGKAKRTYNNILFDSELECNYYKHLLQQKAEGKVVSIELQPKFLLFDGYTRKCDGKRILPIYYVSDFRITYDDGVKIIDTKGNPDNLSLMKRKLVEGLYPDIDFHWISWSVKDGGWIEYDELQRLRKERKNGKKQIIHK